jgi:hypothetical protein
MVELAKSLKMITLCQFLNKTKEFINKEEMLSALVKLKRRINLRKAAKSPGYHQKERRNESQEVGKDG